MQTVLIVIHLLVVIALVAVVLLQRSEGGALGIGGGGGFMTGRGQANALSRATAILGALFFATSLIMSIIAGWSRAPRSIIDNAAPSSTSAPADKTAPGQGGNLLDQLKKMQDERGGAPAPVAPAPAPAQDSPQ
jgi:preprotein translocase subunit SecG